MIEFILNDTTIRTEKPGGMTLLDFIRYDNSLTGTKIGCREGDCGACTVLIGQLVEGKLKYQSMTCCITPLINASGKHVVTIEGLNMETLTPVQQAMVDCGGTQCGFCTVGFVTSLSGYCLENSKPDYEDAISAIDGNICRCTGYKSIERASSMLVKELAQKDPENSIEWLVENDFIPTYFNTIAERLSDIKQVFSKSNGRGNGVTIVGGGTDLYVQQAEELVSDPVQGYFDVPQLNEIELTNSTFKIGGAVTVSDLLNSNDFNSFFPNLRKHLKLVSSTQIRNMGTLAGNFVNASPIGDMTIFFLALDAAVVLQGADSETRNIKLKHLYKGYKTLDLRPGELVLSVQFELPNVDTHFNFEKVSKRTYLDIASVNSAVKMDLEGDIIRNIHLSAGGVSPVPMYLFKTCKFLEGKGLNEENVLLAMSEIESEITPISDVRGSANYKKLLLRQLFLAHFIELFPKKFEMEAFV